MKRAVLAFIVLICLTGCGDDSASETTTTTAETSTARVYFLREGKVWPVARPGFATPELSTFPLMASLAAGPSTREHTDLGLMSAVDGSCGDGCARTNVPVIVGAAAQFDPGVTFSKPALAQVVYTLTQFPTVRSVEYKGKRYTRADFEDQTPAILVEAPLPFADVTSPITASGTANTFEATFNYELLDAHGEVVDQNFVTATSGTGTRGTFEFTTGNFDQASTLVVFEPSAENGSRTKLVEIPLSSSS